MSRICRNMGDSGKLRFYELDHESKMRLLKTHSHTSNGLAMEPGPHRVYIPSPQAQAVRAPLLILPLPTAEGPSPPPHALPARHQATARSPNESDETSSDNPRSQSTGKWFAIAALMFQRADEGCAVLLLPNAVLSVIARKRVPTVSLFLQL